ncbi:EamA family transporter [Silvimonas iriomotensis]|uniref:EamA domain-containing protein n=1 Tax=Silvimonas iriomotensis TaxID=449662 RepID=A0ABQ2PDL8_9NEIS|nr:EamA family transporter [Silvimonas iriomotensis]GGP23644.1 hypothetical protein GCM10010970_36440 [Silvimonas iriomotensis]
MSLVHLFIIIFATGLAALGSLCLKLAALRLPTFSVTPGYALALISNPYLIVGAALHVVPLLIWVYLLKFVDLSKLQPMMSMVYVFSAVLAYLVLQEPVGGMRIAGICIIIVGVCLVSIS